MSNDDSTDDELSPETETETETGGAGGSGKNNDHVACAGGDDDDKVGYGRPPKAHRFKPGQSGNPRGRPKGAKGLKTMLRKELNSRVRITENGKSRWVTKMEVIIKRLAEHGVKGNLKAIGEAIAIGAHVYGMDDEPDRLEPLTADEQAIVDAARERHEWLEALAKRQGTDGQNTNDEDFSGREGEDEE